MPVEMMGWIPNAHANSPTIGDVLCKPTKSNESIPTSLQRMNDGSFKSNAGQTMDGRRKRINTAALRALEAARSDPRRAGVLGGASKDSGAASKRTGLAAGVSVARNAERCVGLDRLAEGA